MVSVSSLLQTVAAAVAVNAAYIPQAPSQALGAQPAPSAPFPQLNVTSPVKRGFNETALEKRYSNSSSSSFIKRQDASNDTANLVQRGPNLTNVFDFTKRSYNETTDGLSKRGLSESNSTEKRIGNGPAPPFNGSTPLPSGFNHTGPSPDHGPAPHHKRDLGKIKSFLSNINVPTDAGSAQSPPTELPTFNSTSF